MHRPKPLRILVTGATGFVGRALSLRLARDGHQVLAWVRSPERARALLGAGPELVPAGDEAALNSALPSCDAVVHLAGENLFAGRWTSARKRRLVESRVGLTQRLLAALEACPARPRTLVAASAIGFYGDRGDEVLDEESARGEGFLADLCERWEASARGAARLGTRVCSLRIGIVLGAEGGALARMLLPFHLGLGGRLGSGRQWMSWIALDDLLEMIVRALHDPRWSGPVNATAPEPVTNADFTRALGHALGRPTCLPVPACALRLALGEAAGVLLGGQRVRPRRALELGLRFRHPVLASALQAQVQALPTLSIGAAREVPDVPYLRERRARFLLEQTTHIDAPLAQVFEFFSRAENLGAMTPPRLSFSIRTALPIGMRPGAQIEYRMSLGPLPMSWRTRIDLWEPGRRFVDCQLKGPYRAWYHEHSFAAHGDTTLMSDRVWYAPPWGPLGGLANVLFVAPQLRGIFGFRSQAIARRFGLAPRTPANGPNGTSGRPREAARVL